MSDPRVEALARELSCRPPQGESWKMGAPEARRLLEIIDKVGPARVLADAAVALMRSDGLPMKEVQAVADAVWWYLCSKDDAAPDPPLPDYDNSECCASGRCEVCSPWLFR